MAERKLANWLESYMEYTENSEPAYLFRKWSAVSVLAAVLRRKCYMPILYNVYPNMYIALVGPPGASRKGTAMEPGLRLLRRLGIKLAADATTREALIRELSETTEMYIDGTGKKAGMHSSITIYSKELAVFLGFKNPMLLADLCDWFDCNERWKNQTKNCGVEDIINVWVNLIGATTPDLLQSMLPPDVVGGGLTSRTIFVFEATKGKVVPLPFPTSKELKLLEDLYSDLEQISTTTGAFAVTRSWTDSYVMWYTGPAQIPVFRSGPLQYYNDRRQIHLMKLCIIMCVSRTDSMVIDGCDFDSALKLLQETEAKMHHAFGGFGKNKEADVQFRIMQTIGINKKTTVADLMRYYHQDIDKDTLASILYTLEQMKFCTLKATDAGTIVEFISSTENLKTL